MAAFIGGTTIHEWGCIPVNATEAANKTNVKASDGDLDPLFLNALGVRWLIIDESSTASAHLLGLLKTTCAALAYDTLMHTDAKRKGHSAD